MARGVEHMAQIHVRAGAEVQGVQHPECLHLRMGDVTIFLWDDDVREALIAALQKPRSGVQHGPHESQWDITHD